jgi:N-acetyl-gamma-glutamyl-phosphate/LysW-gamma-L-alpha-aminoadipyl-6-phosphate reductase
MNIAVVGASGYAGGELLRLLTMPSGAEVVVATSESYSGRPIHSVHYNLKGYYRGLRFSRYSLDLVSKKADAVFLALPHGSSLHKVPELLDVGMLVIDLSADYRLKDPSMYERWYGYEHPYPDLLKKAVYGLPELHRDELRNAKLVASPGCNATSSILALAPVVKEGLIETDGIVIDVKAGSSEAGSKPAPHDHHPEREGSVRPYAGEGHRHVAEVEQELGVLTRSKVSASLTPHAIPSVRGSFASAYARTLEELDDKIVLRAFTKMYGKEPFIRIVRNTPLKYPSTKYVIGSNFADVSFALEGSVLKTFAAIDNLMKGAAGQALQAFNIAAGFDESEGLRAPPLRPA